MNEHRHVQRIEAGRQRQIADKIHLPADHADCGIVQWIEIRSQFEDLYCRERLRITLRTRSHWDPTFIGYK